MLTIFTLILITTIYVHAADFDEDAQATCMCFTHIICDLKQYGMALDIIGDNEVAYKHFEFLILKVAEENDINFDRNRVKDRDAWEEYSSPVCKMSEELKPGIDFCRRIATESFEDVERTRKAKLCIDWLKNWTAATSEVCAEEPEHCDDMCKPSETAYDIALEYYGRGDCTTIGENPFQMKGL